MRLRENTIGSLNLLSATTGSLDGHDLAVAQAIANVATISVLQHRIAAEQQLLSEQLQRALDSRVVIEQAKGVLAARGRIGTDEAFDRMRNYTCSRNLLLADVAATVVNRDLDADEIVEPPTA